MSASQAFALDEEAAVLSFPDWHIALAEGKAKEHVNISMSLPSVIARPDNELLCSWKGTGAGIKLRTVVSKVNGFNSYIKLRFSIRYKASPSDTKLAESTASIRLFDDSAHCPN